MRLNNINSHPYEAPIGENKAAGRLIDRIRGMVTGLTPEEKAEQKEAKKDIKVLLDNIKTEGRIASDKKILLNELLDKYPKFISIEDIEKSVLEYFKPLAEESARYLGNEPKNLAQLGDTPLRVYVSYYHRMNEGGLEEMERKTYHDVIGNERTIRLKAFDYFDQCVSKICEL